MELTEYVERIMLNWIKIQLAKKVMRINSLLKKVDKRLKQLLSHYVQQLKHSCTNICVFRVTSYRTLCQKGF